MTVVVTDGFRSSVRWTRIAGSVAAALREARLGAWHVTIRPADEPSTVFADTGDVDFHLSIRADVADMSLEVSIPVGELPLEDDDLGRMLVAYIQEAEDETPSEYGPTDEDDFPDRTS